MVDPRHYSRGTITALALLSQGTCYWPDPLCFVPATVPVKGHPVFNLEIAHIRAARPNGPRYVPNMTNDQRRAFANLIFLCTPHHLFVDKIRPQDYPIEVLEKWKRDRETGKLAQLRLQGNITEDHFQEIVADALEEKIKEVREAIARIEQIDTDAAALLRELADQMNRPTFNTEVAEMLRESASILHPILEEGNVNSLYFAAQQLSEMQSYLAELPHIVAQLQQFRREY
jgi:iron-sulfur cluster repair protein YtfE (RIC family)